jgi:hypothetical protein
MVGKRVMMLLFMKIELGIYSEMKKIILQPILLRIETYYKMFLITNQIDTYGNDWYAETQPDRTQVWSQVRNGKIINGGVNQKPKSFNEKTGLKSPSRGW